MALSVIKTNSIAADAITAAKIAAGTIVAYDLAANSVDSSELVNGSVDLAHMSADSVDSDQYVNGSIDNAHLAANSVDSDQYVDGSIDNAHLAVNSVDSDQYVDGSIDNAHIADMAASKLTGTVANARLDAQLQDVAGLAVTDSGFIVGNGSNFVLETGATLRTSMGVGTGNDVQFDSFGTGKSLCRNWRGSQGGSYFG